MTKDNMITNRLVRQGKLPKSQAEVFPNPDKKLRRGAKSKRKSVTPISKMNPVKRGALKGAAAAQRVMIKAGHKFLKAPKRPKGKSPMRRRS